MKIKYGVEWLSLNSEKDRSKIEMDLMDNGDWEYNRVGIGMNKGKVFMICTDDIGEDIREVEYCKNVKSIEELLKIGVECKVFEKIGDGYDEDDEYRVNVNDEIGDKDWSKFGELVGWKSSENYYSFMGKE